MFATKLCMHNSPALCQTDALEIYPCDVKTLQYFKTNPNYSNLLLHKFRGHLPVVTSFPLLKIKLVVKHYSENL